MIELNSIVKHKNSYYIILDTTPRGGYVSVKKCSKTGKLYKYSNGFEVTALEAAFKGEKYNSFEIIRRGGGTPEKANIENGIESGKIKRRIRFLENRIIHDNKELLELKKKV